MPPPPLHTVLFVSSHHNILHHREGAKGEHPTPFLAKGGNLFRYKGGSLMDDSENSNTVPLVGVGGGGHLYTLPSANARVSLQPRGVSRI